MLKKIFYISLLIFSFCTLCIFIHAADLPSMIHANEYSDIVSLGELWNFDISPDGLHSCITSRKGTFLLDRTFNIIHQYSFNSFFTNFARFSPDGGKLLIMDEGSSGPGGITGNFTYIYDIHTQEVLFRSFRYQDDMHFQPFSPDGRHIIVTDVPAKEIQTIDLATQERKSYPGILRFQGIFPSYIPNDFVFFSSDNRYLVDLPIHGIADATNYLEFWDRDSGELAKKVPLEKVKHQQSYSRDGKHIVVGEGPEENSYAGYEYLQYPTGYYHYLSDIYLTPVLWDGITGNVIRKWPELFFGVYDPPTINLSRDGRWLTLGNTIIDLTNTIGEVKQIPNDDVENIDSNRSSLHPTQPIYYKKNKSFLGSTIEAWDMESLTLRNTLNTAFTYGNINTGLSTQSSLAALGLHASRLHIWDYSRGEGIAELVPSIPSENAGNYVGSTDFSPDGKYLLWGSLNSFSLWDTNTWENIFEQETGVPEYGTIVKFSPDGKTFATSILSTQQSPTGNPWYDVALWDIESRRLRQRLSTASDIITSIAFSSDGKWVASSHNNQIQIFDIPNNKTIEFYLYTIGLLDSVYGFLPDSTELIGASNMGTIYKVDAVSGQVSGEIFDFQTPVVLAPNGSYLVCGSVIYDARSMKQVTVLENEKKDYVSLSISRDGKRLLTCDEDTGTKVWDLESLLGQSGIDFQEGILHQ